MANNFVDSTTATFTTSTAGFPSANSLHNNRGKYWLPAGNWVIEAGVNDKIYINDGSDKTATLDPGNYGNTPLATEVQTQLNAVSSNWTCTYSVTTRKFTIARSSGTAILKLSTTTTAAWDTLGFVGTADRPISPFLADEPRKHGVEYIQLDLGVATEVDYIGIVGPIGDVFGISPSANVTIKANNVDLNWPTAPYSESITPTERGIFHSMDGDADKYYRYWRLEIDDATNPADMAIGYVYIGGAVQPTSSNISRGFRRGETDPSNMIESENGHLYFDTRTRYTRVSAANITNVSAADRLEIEKIAHDFGKHTPLFVAFDPTEALSASADELSWYAFFETPPEFSHLFLDYYTISMSLREAV
jgi:hypothetical protein